MLKRILLNNQTLHKAYYSCGMLSILLQWIKSIIIPTKKIDISQYFNEINGAISSLELKVFPMFGTLLCYYRDGDVKNTDDYDYAIFDLNSNVDHILKKLRGFGFSLMSLSYINLDGEDKLVELSFKYKEARVDIFDLCINGEEVIHRCPNFRKETPVISLFKKGITKNSFSSYFEVSYKKFNLELDDKINIYLPELMNIEDIFVRHYGVDWKTPKKTNFIDYKFYKFLKSDSYCLQGEEKHLIEYIGS
ncbi:hypothetical protein DX885_001619 [Vibrio mimicus]